MTKDIALKKLKSYGFRMWNANGLLLIPQSRLKSVPKEFVLTSIQGDKKKASAVDTDTRGGLLAWGVTPDQYTTAVRWFQ